MKKSYILILFIFGCVVIYAAKVLDDDQAAEKLNFSEITVQNDSEWHRIAGRKMLSTESKIVLSQGDKSLTKFGFNEAFSWNDEKVTQTVGIRKLLSHGITLFRYWDFSKNTDPKKRSMTGWIVLCKTGDLSEEEVADIKFDNTRVESYTTNVGKIKVLLKQTHHIELDK